MNQYRLNQVTVANVLRACWKMFKENFPIILLIGLLSAIGNYLNEITEISLLPIQLIMYILISLILVPVIMAIYELEIYDADVNERPISIASMFENFNMDLARLAIKRNLIIFAWYFALIIPGIYYTYAYARVLFIKHDHPELTDKECFEASKREMTDYKLTLFAVQLAVGLISLIILMPLINTILNSNLVDEISTAITSARNVSSYDIPYLAPYKYLNIMFTTYPLLTIALGLIELTLNSFVAGIDPIFQSLRTKEKLAAQEL